MSKTERLMAVLGLVRDHGPVTLTTIANKCGISPRTVYRYIESLQNLNYPVYYDNGYCLRKEVSLPQTDLSPDEIALIRFCLRNNPFLGDNYFVRHFERIDRKLGRRIDHTSEKGSVVFETGRESITAEGKKSGDPLLERFTDAIVRRKQVRLVQDSLTDRPLIVTPVSIRLRRGHVELVVRDGGSARTRIISRNHIVSIDILEPQKSIV